MQRLLALLLLTAIGGAQAVTAPADLVLEHGTVLTLDTADHTAQALAVRDGKIIAMGSDAQITPLIGPHTKVIDLHGRTATPGLIDTHAHILQGKLTEL
jgi:predicted amidohydrolase YtcJ